MKRGEILVVALVEVAVFVEVVIFVLLAGTVPVVRGSQQARRHVAAPRRRVDENRKQRCVERIAWRE